MSCLTLAIQTMIPLISICLLIHVNGQNVNATASTSAGTISSSTVNPPANISCEIYNNDCKACVANSQCYYCDTDDKCNFHIQNIIADGECPMSKAHFLTCRVNFKIMMIIIGVLAGIAFLIITIVCCYCCCKRKGVKGLSKDELKWARQKEERKQIADQKRKERAERTDEIRRKYGLVKDSNPYQRFDA